jgi:hypothetical protein
MTQTQQEQQRKMKPKPVEQTDSGNDPPADEQKVSPALPHEPDVSAGAVDVVGILPDDVHVDPGITEGHAGYEESGSSEVRPPLSAKSE